MTGKVYGVYFSPCGNVEKTIHAMADHAAQKLGTEAEYIDFTLPRAREGEYSFCPGDLVFFGTPVYAGRVPNKIAPFVAGAFHGGGAWAASIVCFGNRAFDNALGELCGLLESDGFRVASAAAVVSEHSFTGGLASGRPDAPDLDAAQEFAGKTVEKLQKGGAELPAGMIPGERRPEKYYTPLGTDGRPAVFLKAVPDVDMELCDRCGICAEVCPMGSIDASVSAGMRGICIKCHACIRKCPKGARSFSDPAFLSHRDMLLQNYTRRAESVYIIGG